MASAAAAAAAATASEASADEAVDVVVTLASIASTTTTTPSIWARACRMRYAKTGVSCFFLIKRGDVCSRYETCR